MRSRYSAYATGAIDHLLKTHDPETRDEFKRDSMERWSKSTNWQGLSIVATEKGGVEDDTGIVEFIARGSTNGKPFALHERSRFRRIDGAWYYVDGTYS
jgi:SEC-C motif-containing protein